MISEKGLCKDPEIRLQRRRLFCDSCPEDGGGGGKTTWRRNEIILNGATWAVRCLEEELPKAVAVQIVEDTGYMPMDPVTVCKGEPNQTMIESVANLRGSELDQLKEGSFRMMKIPVIFRDRWQLYQTDRGAVYAFDTSC